MDGKWALQEDFALLQGTVAEKIVHKNLALFQIRRSA
jgi:hypothetical protein